MDERREGCEETDGKGRRLKGGEKEEEGGESWEKRMGYRGRKGELIKQTDSLLDKHYYFL